MDDIIRLEGIGKKFGGNYVLQDVSMGIRRGDIHAIIGENGAGKSTLMKIIGGVYQPNDGSIYKNGEQIRLHNAIEAYSHGIGIVHQELSVVGNLSIAENIFAGRQPVNAFGFVQEKKMCREAQEILDDMGISLDPHEKVENLSVAMQQVIEIVKVASHKIDVLILDEPTSSLSANEIEHLFALVRRMRDEKQMTVIFISHKLDEVKAICNRVSVLRNGRLIGHLTDDEITSSNMIRMMVGDNLDSQSFLPPNADAGELILQVDDLCNGKKFQHISFSARKGRILGMFGLIGAGRTETVMSVIGADSYDSGRIVYEGQEVCFRSPKRSIAKGIVYLTENRRDLGLFLTKPIADNIIAASLQDFTTRWKTMARRKIDETTDEYIKKLNIRPPVKDRNAATYSGGNQQKILFSKALLAHPKVLIVDEPTRGVDVGVKMTIHRMLRELADSGIAVIVISSELPEILRLSDEILVMHEGHSCGIMQNAGLTERDVMTRVYAAKKEVQE